MLQLSPGIKMSCRSGNCRAPAGARGNLSSAPRRGVEYILFWMPGCTHCNSAKQQIKFCRDNCTVVREINVSDQMSQQDATLFNQYGNQRVPLLLKTQNGRAVAKANSVSDIVSILQQG